MDIMDTYKYVIINMYVKTGTINRKTRKKITIFKSSRSRIKQSFKCFTCSTIFFKIKITSYVICGDMLGVTHFNCISGKPIYIKSLPTQD